MTLPCTNITLSVSGYGSTNYEVTHTGGKWELFYRNCLLLSEYIKKYNANINVTMYFHVNKNSLHEYKDMYDFCVQLGFRLLPVISYIYADYAMDYLENKPLCEAAVKAKDLMVIDLDEMIAVAKKDHEKPCTVKRVVPVIAWDMSVYTCCKFQYEKIADNYLDVSLDEIITLRNKSGFCDKCISYSLHRYQDLGYFLDEINRLLSENNPISSSVI
jgi:MoaA/NifB/PqqE/SkfB family radical SAM enzyme